jgi:[ribosomal protein S18]-alanine N-acetyltransferase
MRERDVADVASLDETTRMNEEHLRTELARAWARTWVARESDRVVGYILTWHVADELHVMNVATRADRRRRGDRARADATRPSRTPADSR